MPTQLGELADQAVHHVVGDRPDVVAVSRGERTDVDRLAHADGDLRSRSTRQLVTRCAPAMAMGTMGAPDCSARRTAPVLARSGHFVGVARQASLGVQTDGLPGGQCLEGGVERATTPALPRLTGMNPSR